MNYFYGIGPDENVLHFGGMDDPEKIKSSEWNYIIFEEATQQEAINAISKHNDKNHSDKLNRGVRASLEEVV